MRNVVIVLLLVVVKSVFAQSIDWVRAGGFYPNDYASESLINAKLIDDFNGDGYPEAVVISAHVLYGHRSEYLIRFYWGGPGFLDTVLDFEITLADTNPEPPFHSLIETITIIGDVNGDGYNDLALGMPDYTDEWMTYNCGKVFVYFGGPDMDTICDWSFSSSEHYCHYLGSYLNGLGDWNSDGYDDFIINGSWDDGYALGRIYIFLGGSPLSTTPAKVICGPSEGYSLGGCVVGDIDGDSLSDIITAGWTEEGMEFGIIRGNTDIDSVFLETIFTSPDAFGITPVGDINGDGQKDVFLKLGYVNFSILTDISPLTMTPFDYPHWYAGLSIIRDIGDVNCDGIDDIYVFDRSGDFTDYVSYTSILAGHTSLDFTELFSSESLWGAIDIGKDLNADGYPEAIVMDAIQVSPDSAYWWYDLITLNPDYSIVDEANPVIPKKITLSAYPNPFNSSVRIAVEGEWDSPVQIEIYDVAGRKIQTLRPSATSLEKGGTDSVPLFKGGQGGSYIWQPDESLPSGVYLVRARFSEETITRRVVYLK